MTDEHQAIEMLLPWYVTGRLDSDEVVQVDAHIMQCEACREMLAQERLLKADIAAMPYTVPRFFSPAIADNQRISVPWRGWKAAQKTVSGWKAKSILVAAFATAQAAILLIVFQMAQPEAQPDAEYRTLSAGRAASEANAIVTFNADTREATFRAILVGAGATIVGGPTETNAYLLRVEVAKRDHVLDMLRKQPEIMLAQPVDQE